MVTRGEVPKVTDSYQLPDTSYNRYEGTKRRSDPGAAGTCSATDGRDSKLSIVNLRLSIGRVACVIVLVTALTAQADEVISRTWTIYNSYTPEPTFTEAISRADTVRNNYTPEPMFTEAISRANSQCNIGIFVDEDDDTVHDCNDICQGGNDLIDNDNNNIPDECEPGSCCLMAGGFPACFNSNKLECESPPFSGVYGGEGSVCDQNVAIVHEPSGEVFIHLVGPPATCNPGGAQAAHGAGGPPPSPPSATAGLTPPPKLDVWKTAGTVAHSFSPANGGTPIPAGFFGAGSDVFAGSVDLQGVSLNDPLYPGADTIIRRSDSPFDLCTPGPFPVTADPVAIEIIALSLANPASAPLIVTYGGANPEEWDATVSLGGTAPMGTLTATKEHCNGGTFTSVLNVMPQFTFRRRSNGTLRGLIPPTHMTFTQTEAGPWVHEVSPVFDAAIDESSAFHAGFDMIMSPATCGVDTDGDSLRAECDNCPGTANADQLDTDDDGVGDLCDNCPLVDNPLQENCDGDSDGDACDTAFADCQPDGIPDGCQLAAQIDLTQNSALTVGSQVACGITGNNCTHANWWGRCFPISDPTTIEAVQFGVTQADGPLPSGVWQIEVNLWAENDSTCPPSSPGTATLLGQTTIPVSSSQVGQLLTATFSPSVAVAPGTALVVEVGNSASGCALGNGIRFRTGANSSGQTGPSYLRSPVCGFTSWTDHASFGFSNLHTVLVLETIVANGNDQNDNGIPDMCDAPDGVIPEPNGEKTRFLSFSAPASAAAAVTPGQTAIKVTMIDLQNPVPPNLPANPPPNFSAYESATCFAPGETAGCARWVGKPGTFLESQDLPGLGSFAGARLQCTPYYHDFAGEGMLHVTGAEIVPSSTYEVEVFAATCKGDKDDCAAVSAPVTMYTRRSGDVEVPFNPPSTTTQPDVTDVAQLVNKFKSLPGAPIKAVSQLQPNLPELNADINALDIVAVVDAVKQRAYAFGGPCPCPSMVTCGSMSCSSATPCIAAHGAGALCVKTCTGPGPLMGDPCINNTHCVGSGTCGAGFCRDRCGRCSP